MRDGVYALSHDGLSYPGVDGQPQLLPCAAIEVMQLRLLPGRLGADQYACEIVAGDIALTLHSKDLQDYAGFVRALHIQAASHQPRIQFGRPLSRLRKIVHGSFQLLLVLAMSWLLLQLYTAPAPGWVSVTATLLTIGYVAVAVQWFALHWTGRYDPFNLPRQLLPR